MINKPIIVKGVADIPISVNNQVSANIKKPAQISAGFSSNRLT